MEDFSRWLENNLDRKRRKKGQREVEQCFTHLSDEVARIENLPHTDTTKYLHDDIRTLFLGTLDRLHGICGSYGYYVDPQREIGNARERYQKKSENARALSLQRKLKK